MHCRKKTEKGNGASDEGRTHNLLHGKQMLYQLSYTRIRKGGSIPMRGGFGKRIFGKRILALEIVHYHASTVGLEDFLHKFQMPRVFLINILRGLVIKNQVQRHLVRLINHVPMATRHCATVIVHQAGDVLEIFLRAGEQFFRSIGHLGLSPKNNNVRKHSATLIADMSSNQAFGKNKGLPNKNPGRKLTEQHAHNWKKRYYAKSRKNN